MRFKDVGRVERGGQNYDPIFGRTASRQPAWPSINSPAPTLSTVAESVRKEMEKLKGEFPEGHALFDIPFDTTKFVDASIHEVYKTLFEAGVLVLIVILVFLQDWRAVLVAGDHGAGDDRRGVCGDGGRSASASTC